MGGTALSAHCIQGGKFVREGKGVVAISLEPSGPATIRPKAGDKTPLEFTQWSTIADLAGKRYYVKTYDSQVLHRIDLMSFDLNAKAIRTAPLKPVLAVPALDFPKP
jgi:hypothetical protein